MRRLSHALPAAAWVAAWILSGATHAWAAGFDLAGGKSEAPIEIYADEGIEWDQDEKRVTARVNGKAIRNNVTVLGDTLVAHYRETNGKNEIYRLVADGNVRIFTATETATGTHATYELDNSLFTLTGAPKVVSPTDTITAVDSIQYYEDTKVAVAKGNALAVRAERRVRGDKLTAWFKDSNEPAPGAAPAKGQPAKGQPAKGQAAPAKGPANAAKPPAAGAHPAAAHPDGTSESGSLELTKAKAEGHVVLTTATEVVTGDWGDYDAETGIATVTGSVKITRADNQLDGGYAIVNLDTGISKLFAAPPGGPPPAQRVTGLIVPQNKDSGDKPKAADKPKTKPGQATAKPADTGR